MSDTVEKSVAASPGENDQELDIIKEKITQYQKNGEQSHIGNRAVTFGGQANQAARTMDTVD